jgi:hypothetical protein
MDDGIGLVVLVGILALCAIVGIYYCMVRKTSKTEKTVEHSQSGSPQ